MGIEISVLKPTKYLGEKEPEVDNGWVCIYSLGFDPIQHLKHFKQGYWEAKDYGDTSLHCSYRDFNHFRGYITSYLFGKEYRSWVRSIVEVEMDFPFAEMLFFADNEGSFDYEIAEKLLIDFRQYREAIMPTIEKEFYRNYYDLYTKMLEEVVECRGVAFYH